MKKLEFLLLLVALNSEGAWAVKPVVQAGQSIEKSNQLVCANAQLNLKSRLSKKTASSPAVVINQRLQLEAAKTPLPPEKPPAGVQIKNKNHPPMYLSGWACVTNAQGQAFFYLAFYCAQENVCAGNKEWARLMALDGTILNTQPGGLETVMRQRGLEGYLEKGVDLLDPLEP